MRYALLLSAVLVLAQVTGSHLGGVYESSTEEEFSVGIDDDTVNGFMSEIENLQRLDDQSMTRNPLGVQNNVALTQPWVESKDLSHSELSDMLDLGQWFDENGYAENGPFDTPLGQSVVASTTTMTGQFQQATPTRAIDPPKPSFVRQGTSQAAQGAAFVRLTIPPPTRPAKQDQQTNLAQPKRPQRSGLSRPVESLNDLPLQNGRQTVLDDRYGNVNNAHNIHDAVQQKGILEEDLGFVDSAHEDLESVSTTDTLPEETSSTKPHYNLRRREGGRAVKTHNASKDPVERTFSQKYFIDPTVSPHETSSTLTQVQDESASVGSIRTERSNVSRQGTSYPEPLNNLSLRIEQQIMPTNETIRTYNLPFVMPLNHTNGPLQSTDITNGSTTRDPIIRAGSYTAPPPTRVIPLAERERIELAEWLSSMASSQPTGGSTSQSVINQPLSAHPSSLEQVDRSHEMIESSSNWVKITPQTWPFSFKRQFVVTPSHVNLDKSKLWSGITGRSHQLGFTARSSFIIITDGWWNDLSGSNYYNNNLVKVIKESESAAKKGFGINQNGLCAILENVKDEDGNVQMYLHERVIGRQQLPVTLKVMRRNKNKWEAVPTNEELGNLKSYKVMEGDILIIGEATEMETERNLPTESIDLFGSLEKTKGSPFRFLILAQLIDSTISKEEFMENLS